MLDHVTARAFQMYLKFLPLAAAALAFSGCKCPPGTAANRANVESIVQENDAARARSDEPDSVKAAKDLRNREALALAVKLAEACR